MFKDGLPAQDGLDDFACQSASEIWSMAMAIEKIVLDDSKALAEIKKCEISIRTDFAGLVRSFVRWVTSANSAFLGMFLVTGVPIFMVEPGIYHLLFESHNAAGGFLAMVISFSLGLYRGIRKTPLMALALVRLSRLRVTLTENKNGEQLLRVGPASLPGRFIADAVPVKPADKQAQLGPELDPRAFVLHRPWVGPAVRLVLNDPEDPTPYWFFSVRHPEALLKCLRTAHSR